MNTSEREVRILFQVRWVVRIALGTIVASALLLLALRSMLGLRLSTNYDEAFYSLRHMETYLVPAVGFSVLLYLLLVSAFVGIISLFLSHRLAGPLFRMEKFAEALGRRDLTFPMRLRKGDQLNGLALALRQLQEELARQVKPLGGHFEKTDALWAELEDLGAAAGQERREEILAAIEGELSAVVDRLAPPSPDSPPPPTGRAPV